MKFHLRWLRALGVASGLAAAACSQSTTAEAPNGGRYAALDKLPDMGGTWGVAPMANGLARPPGTGVESDDKIPLIPAALAELKHRRELSAEGKPFATTAKCMPRGGSVFWNGPGGKEIAFLPGKIIIWSGMDHDGNDVRRIYVDGRPHDTYVDSYMGDSIGHWEGDTLVVDTIGFWPTVSAAMDIPNGGDMHMVERLHLDDPNTLKVEAEITAPKVLTAPYKFTRTLVRKSGHEFEARETICLSGANVDKVDENGFQYLETAPPADLVLPPGVKLSQ